MAAFSIRTPAPAACRNCRSPRIGADRYCGQCGRKAPAGRDHAELYLGVPAGVTDGDLRHRRNEDAMALAATQTPAGPAPVVVVCDGVSTSGKAQRSVARRGRQAVRVLAAALRAGVVAGEEALMTAVLAADSAVRDLPRSLRECTGGHLRISRRHHPRNHGPLGGRQP